MTTEYDDINKIFENVFTLLFFICFSLQPYDHLSAKPDSIISIVLDMVAKNDITIEMLKSGLQAYTNVTDEVYRSVIYVIARAFSLGET